MPAQESLNAKYWLNRIHDDDDENSLAGDAVKPHSQRKIQ